PDVVVLDAGVAGADLARDVGRVPHHFGELHRARIDAVDGRDGVLPDLDRVQARVGQRLAQGPELLASVGLHLAVHHRAPIRPLEGLAHDPVEVGQVGGAERLADVTGCDHAVAGKDAGAERQAVVVAGVLGRAGLRSGALAL